MPADAVKPKGGQFAVSLVQLALRLVLEAGVSLRGAAQVLALVAEQWQLPFDLPSASTIRSWLLRFGYFLLRRPLPVHNDWVWLIDHSAQSGATKLCVIVGCRLSDISFGQRCLRLPDLQLLALLPMTSSTGTRVAEVLEQTVARTGVPRLIVSDLAGDLQGGVTQFQQKHTHTLHVHDTAHHGANLLQKRWEKDERWLQLLEQFRKTNQRIRQTAHAFLLSPTIRAKARFMNVAPLLRFASRVLVLLARPTCAPTVRERYGWLEEYRTALAGWQEEHQVVQSLLEWVRLHGLERRSYEYWKLYCYQPSLRKETEEVVSQVRAYLERSGKQAKVGETLLGSTEILESGFGKFKHLEGSQAGGGFTGLTLSFGALLSELPESELKEALDAVPQRCVKSWLAKTLGQSVQYLRRLFNKEADSPNPETATPKPQALPKTV